LSTKTDSGFSPSVADPAGGEPPRRRYAGALGWSSATAISISLLLMLALMAAGPSQAEPAVPRTGALPPYWFHLRPSDLLVGLTDYTMMILGAVGIVLGLIAVARGARPNLRLLAAGAVAVVALMTVMPPAGSTDSLSYATYGRIALIGHNPYSYTPKQLIKSGDPIGKQTTTNWVDTPSVYGPVQTAAAWGAAELGGTNISRIVFWLKLLFAAVFGAAALGIDRVLRRNPAARARAHLLWTVNPLVLWEIIAGGHCDALTAGLGVLGLIVVQPSRYVNAVKAGEDTQAALSSYSPPSIGRSFLAGLLIGAAAGVKIPYAVLGLGAAWAARRSPRALAAMVAGAFVSLVPGYLIAGPASVKILSSQSTLVTFDSFWRLIFPPFGGFVNDPHDIPSLLMPLMEVLGLALALLLLWRLPKAYDHLPAVRPALALIMAWLLVWPMQRPWYDAMIFALLAVFPASRVEWVMLIRLLPAAIVMATTGSLAGTAPPPFWLSHFQHEMSWTYTPEILLGVVFAVVFISVIDVWSPRRSPPLASVTPAPG
jgi:hypothetical protein